MKDPVRNALLKPLQHRSARRSLGPPLGPDLGGPGYGQLELALLNERIGTTLSGRWSSALRPPTPGTPRCSRTSGRQELKRRYLTPLLEARSRRASR